MHQIIDLSSIFFLSNIELKNTDENMNVTNCDILLCNQMRQFEYFHHIVKIKNCELLKFYNDFYDILIFLVQYLLIYREGMESSIKLMRKI